MTCIKNLKLSILILLLAAAVSANAEIINRVYAVVGEKVITQYELETLNPKRLQYIYKNFEGDKREEELNKYYVAALDMLTNNYVIEQAAAREGVRVSSREVDGAVKEIIEKNSIDEDKLSELLAASNQTMEQYKWSIKIDILKARLMSTVFRPKIIITEDDIKKYVEANAAALELSDMYELRIMTVDNKEQLDKALADFKDTGDFRSTVMKFSTSGNADNGGYLGWVELAFLDDEIRNTIAGKKGLTEPLEDHGSYRVFYVEGFKNKDNVTGDKRDSIVKTLQEERSKEIFDNWLAEKRKEILIQKKYAY
ncbi:SurA domain protein [Denitrovibrio acetiphilus DSM 12809]|uniref:SurA domain protein n=1 Tax=Denitrovibrio acetiphilus (strain DSM 12809 / NBRC 114555 / N2460) TaxID=522772 RepID=D4H2J7_DENA2|nr:SurA N-terminal domain-containing protein [Denitrovibrio acetiphilus]ADD67058.1 SurA domain protein [Denitrovibrio acetiphilus DSM 12809]